MQYSFIRLNDLPDEILIIILKKLHNIEVLYSLLGVNKRLDTIVLDSIFTRNLTIRRSFNGLNQLPNAVLDRFCLEILPKIHHKIEWIDVEFSSLERILLSTNYPNLNGLGLYDLTSERARDFFIDSNLLICAFKNQISSLVIDINKYEGSRSSIKDINIYIFTQIFTMFSNLKYLKFGPSSSVYHRLTLYPSLPNVFSSTLLELHVVLHSYSDCLYLLDGRFNQLHALSVLICSFSGPLLTTINNEKKLPNLKCFSFTQNGMIYIYDTFLVPLLRRMANLEQLSLYFIAPYGPIIDGDHLEKNIINYMTKLNKFRFSIHSSVLLNEQIYLPSNEDIQKSFRKFKKNHIISNVDYFSQENQYHCHVFSYPYTLTYYDNITNNFPGGLFKCVRKISLFDERPFEHDFFIQIAQCFPYVEKLNLRNWQLQKNENQQCSIIEYPHLIELDLVRVHENYVEQFLDNRKISLPNYVYLYVDYRILDKVTHNFTRDATRMNCSKINDLLLLNKPAFAVDLKDYFPHAKIE
ncbi:unnamed protein product [Rotaria sp. Silwood2]|nr:unnamed protein product [Rotaria sp. Silwood2]CAF4699238.1 unnamed protein product [Rotaria sp. Silwood2]